MFNLQLEDLNKEWNAMKMISFNEDLNIDFQFLDSLIPPSNPDLGRSMHEILANLWKEDKTV